jgi:hypothetical protein
VILAAADAAIIVCSLMLKMNPFFATLSRFLGLVITQINPPVSDHQTAPFTARLRASLNVSASALY